MLYYNIVHCIKTLDKSTKRDWKWVLNASFVSSPGALTECYDELGNRYQLPVYCLSPPVNMIEERNESETIEVPEAPASEGQECQLRLRLSTGRDLRLAVRTSDNVQQMKRRLQTQEGVVATSQRWFFSGRPLADKMKLEELKISRDYVVQVIVSQPPTTPPLPQNPTPVENEWLVGDINHHTKCVSERISMCMGHKIFQKISLFLDWPFESRVNL